jgi:histidine triad (HIT) family protein
MKNCLFCQIVDGTADARIVAQDDRAVAFHDKFPQAPTHVLVVPRRHIASLDDAGEEDADLLGHLLLMGNKVARELGLVQQGYRTVINTGAGAGQSVFHIHVHLLGGRPLGWPPG